MVRRIVKQLLEYSSLLVSMKRKVSQLPFGEVTSKQQHRLPSLLIDFFTWIVSSRLVQLASFCVFIRSWDQNVL